MPTEVHFSLERDFRAKDLAGPEGKLVVIVNNDHQSRPPVLGHE
jgi:hypothetical protein